MNLLLARIGLLGILLVAGASAVRAEDSLSSLILESVKEEWTFSEIIKKFAEKAAKSPHELSSADVEAAIGWQTDKLCGSKAQDGAALGNEDCNRLREALVTTVNREKSVVSLGRELQAIATSYELPIREGQRGEVAVNSAVTGIISVWRVRATDEAATATGLLLRAVSIEKSVSEGKAQSIKSAYDDVGANEAEKEEQQIAMIWRYSAGVRLVRGERPDLPAPKEYAGAAQPERQYLFKRWNNVESQLLDLWNHAKGLTFDPPLKKNEIVMLNIKPDGLPDNVQFWGFLEKKPDDTLDGDVGLQWKIPLDPVFPSLMKEGDDPQPNLGGTYPPQPAKADAGTPENPVQQDGRILCSSPLSRRGYLCRALEHSSSVTCREDPAGDDPDAVMLTACTEKDPKAPPDEWCCLPGGSDEDTGTCSVVKREACEDQGGVPLAKQNQCVEAGCKNIEPPKPKVTTVAGPDVCTALKWTEEGPKCKTVKVECGEAQPGISFDDIKQTGATVTVTLYEQNAVPYRPALLHALSHVVQMCGPTPSAYLKDGEKPEDLPGLPGHEQRERNQACCRVEQEAFAWQFEQLEREGKLDGLGNVGGVPINAKTLAEASADAECRTFFPQAGGCRISFPQTESNALSGVVASLGNDGKECEEIIEEAESDPVFRGMIASATGHADVCSPGKLTAFPPTIGNTMCFIGACAENGAELRRTVPGRVAFGANDEGFAFDGFLKEAIESAGFLTGVPDVKQALPTYHPRQLLWQLDTDLCQKVGLPPQSPTTSCVLATSRRLGQPLPTYSGTMEAFSNDAREQATHLAESTAGGLATGMRIGTELYVDASGRFVRSFSELLRLAHTLLRSLKETPFPTEMCPIGQPS